MEILTTPDVQQWITQAQHLDLTDATSRRGILLLEQNAIIIGAIVGLIMAIAGWLTYYLSRAEAFLLDGNFTRKSQNFLFLKQGVLIW